MLANAPIGLVFFDRQCRIVRVNQVFAEMTGVALSLHLGRTLPEVLPERIATRLEEAVRHVIESESPVHDLELEGQVAQTRTADLAGDGLSGAAHSQTRCAGWARL